jgi:hypothetical protein
MPVSKNRKGHAKKAALRKTQAKERKNRAERLYREMIAELNTKATSMTDMLNKEEAQVTTNAEDEYAVVEVPESNEPIIINTPGIV